MFEPPFRSRSRSHLVMVSESSTMLLSLVCQCFVEDFASVFIKNVGL